MKHAQRFRSIFRDCKAYLLEHADRFKNVTKEDIESISGGDLQLRDNLHSPRMPAPGD